MKRKIPNIKKDGFSCLPQVLYTYLLRFLQAKEIVCHLLTSKNCVDPTALSDCLCKRLEKFVKIDIRFSSIKILLLWLRRLHNMETCKCINSSICESVDNRLGPIDSFDFRLDLRRKGNSVYILDIERRTARWLHEHGAVYGDTKCPSGKLSYWEITGSDEFTFLGIAESIGARDVISKSFCMFRPGYLYSSNDYLSCNPGCNLVPGIMYSSAGFITNGAFRGPKPILPGMTRRVLADPFIASDRIGVLVDLSEGRLIFFLNGVAQATSIPLDCSKTYYPFISDTTCERLCVSTQHYPPWEIVYGEKSGGIQKK